MAEVINLSKNGLKLIHTCFGSFFFVDVSVVRPEWFSRFYSCPIDSGKKIRYEYKLLLICIASLLKITCSKFFYILVFL